MGFALDPTILAVCVLAACLTCIWIVFAFGRRLQSSAYLRDSLIEGARQQELKVLLRELRDRAIEGPLEANSPPPDGYGPTARLWQPEIYGVSKTSSPYSYGSESAEEKERRLEEERQQRVQEEAFRKWEAEERERYEAARQKVEKEALRRAKNKVPSSIDISLLGGGWAFLLEFSTVIVIIFTVLILGILKILEGKEIATILAAIAGYVLGKASSSTKQVERKPDSPAAASELKSQ